MKRKKEINTSPTTTKGNKDNQQQQQQQRSDPESKTTKKEEKIRHSKKKSKTEEKEMIVVDAINEIDEITTVGSKTTFMEKFLRTFIATRFEEYLASCVLSSVSETIEGVIVDQFEKELTNMIIRCATPQYGILFSLKTYFGAIDTLANETLCVIADRYDYGRRLKRKTKIEIRFERAPIDIFRRYESENILRRADTRVNNDSNLLAFFNDKNLSYFTGYKENDKKVVNLYSTYLNDSLLTSMIIPCEPLNYLLVNTDNSAISSQSLMQERYKKNFISLKECESELSDTKKSLVITNAKLREREVYIKNLISANTKLTELNKTLQDEMNERSF